MYREAHRVLKPGGRLSVSDVLTTRELDDETRRDLELISACIGGAATVDETKQMLEDAGFEDIRITSMDRSKELIKKWSPDQEITSAVISANIEAVKGKK